MPLPRVLWFIGAFLFFFIALAMSEDSGSGAIPSLIVLFMLYKGIKYPGVKKQQNHARDQSVKSDYLLPIQTEQSHPSISIPEHDIKLSTTHFESPKPRARKTRFYSDFTVIDFETTGLSSESDRVVSIGAIKYIDGQPSKKYSTYVNPKRKIPKEASRINGIYDSDVKDKPTFYELMDDFLNFIGDDPVVAHNASFDVGFLKAYINRHKARNPEFAYEFKNKTVDTLKLARAHFPEAPNHKLETLKSIIGMQKYQSHTAADDCMVTGTLYLKCKERAEQ